MRRSSEVVAEVEAITSRQCLEEKPAGRELRIVLLVREVLRPESRVRNERDEIGRLLNASGFDRLLREDADRYGNVTERPIAPTGRHHDFLEVRRLREHGQGGRCSRCGDHRNRDPSPRRAFT